MQAEDERDKNGSEEEDDEKPGKRIAGPRKKFHWDETVRCDTILFDTPLEIFSVSIAQSNKTYFRSIRKKYFLDLFS